VTDAIYQCERGEAIGADEGTVEAAEGSVGEQAQGSPGMAMSNPV